MTQDIIAMAREAGFSVNEKARQHQPNCIFHTQYMVDDLLVRFAELVRDDEREACLRCIKHNATPMEIAAAIRARGQA
jgi:hypothetical protein